MEKLNLNLDEVIQRLPNGHDIDRYLTELYALGRLRHIPNISPANTVFLQSILRERQPQNILEIGCANGYSTLRFWQVAQQANITTMDISKPTADEAQHHFTTCGANIDLHVGNAIEILPMLKQKPNFEPFDFIFIDAHKTSTLDFFIRARKLATADALIIIDDVLKCKDKMQGFYDYLDTNNITYSIEQVDEDDGVMLIQLGEI